MEQSVTKYPRIYLAMDNSFATKRWTRPSEWAKIIRELGVSFVEASADTEADPFYCGFEYLSEWITDVRKAVEAEGLRVANFYTGYTTYRTLGLAHPDPRVRARIVNDWLKVMIRIASTVKAGAGFFIHAISESALQDPAAYAAAEEILYDELAEVARFAHEQGPIPIVLEQMYTPHQPPWTIAGTERYMREVTRRGGPVRTWPWTPGTRPDSGCSSGLTRRRFGKRCGEDYPSPGSVPSPLSRSSGMTGAAAGEQERKPLRASKRR